MALPKLKDIKWVTIDCYGTLIDWEKGILEAFGAEAKKDGFTRFVSCFRPSGSGEHPKGRACDFAADKNGFGGDATGSSRTYGNRLADYFIANASRLGVLYVIWFRRIWLPSSGWKSYSGAGGDPSSDHTNHVHLSMR